MRPSCRARTLPRSAPRRDRHHIVAVVFNFLVDNGGAPA
jgi:hypothetical protein